LPQTCFLTLTPLTRSGCDVSPAAAGTGSETAATGAAPFLLCVHDRLWFWSGFSPVCVRMCVVSALVPHQRPRQGEALCREKLFRQMEQWYGLSPVCVRRCSRSSPWLAKRFSQKVHGNGFSPVWVLSWIMSSPFSGNLFSHMAWRWSLEA
uniref:Uncharacterized protein n=1 Tax=Cyclopterus lumpus TaxID=8103 RepID=A0A8C2WT59_CYCLU